MNQQQPLGISVIEPLKPAIEKVKEILFRPFDIGKWFTIGFCAWLAYLTRAGGGGGNFSYGKNQPNLQLNQFCQQAKDFVLVNMWWIIPSVIIAVILIIILWIVVTWLSSRGRFMFLHCVVENKAEVKIPWHKFREHARSLFLFRILLAIINFVVIALLCLPAVFMIIFISRAGGNLGVAVILGLILNSLILIPVVIIFLLIHKFTEDFVVPIMFLQTTSCTAAWGQFLQLLSARKGLFALYILFQIAIAMVIGTVVLATVCITCCCAGCILAIPYIGTVLMLPILMFKRAYSLFFIRQFGPAFDVFASQITTPDTV